MAKRKKDLARALSNQLDFLTTIEEADKMEPGSFNCDLQLRGWLTKAIRKSGKSRYQVAADLSEALGKDISKYMLDAWTSEAKEEHNIPAIIFPPACITLGDMGGLKILANLARCQLLESKEAVYAEIAKLEQMRDRANDALDHLKRKAQAMDR